MLQKKYLSFIFSFIMSLIMSFVMSGIITALNIMKSIDFSLENFRILGYLNAWLFNSFPLAFACAFPLILLIAPKVRKFSEAITHEDRNLFK